MFPLPHGIKIKNANPIGEAFASPIYNYTRVVREWYRLLQVMLGFTYNPINIEIRDLKFYCDLPAI